MLNQDIAARHLALAFYDAGRTGRNQDALHIGDGGTGYGTRGYALSKDFSDDVEWLGAPTPKILTVSPPLARKG